MYFCDKKMLIFLFASFVITTTTMCGIFFAYFFDSKSCKLLNMVIILHFHRLICTDIAHPFPGLQINFCLIEGRISKHIYTYWIPLICFDTVLLVLAIYRGYDSLKVLLRKGFFRKRMGILEILVKNSVLYYLM